MVFVVHGKPFQAHRCILGARSTYFANMLDTKWKGKSIVVLRHPLVCPSLGGGSRGTAGGLCWATVLTFSPGCLCPQINPMAFGALLQYLYTGDPPPGLGLAGREGDTFLSSSRPSCGLGLTFYCLALYPLQCKMVLAAFWVGWEAMS